MEPEHPRPQLRCHERDQDSLRAISDWRAEIETIETIQSSTGSTLLYIALKEALPDPFNYSDFRFKKVFLYLKNCRHKGVWRIKNMDGNRREIICENMHKNDGTNITWELDVEKFQSPRIVQNGDDLDIEYNRDELNVFVMPAEHVDTRSAAIARLTPPVIISCRATILSISCINLVDQSFIADVHLVFTAQNIGKVVSRQTDALTHIRSQHLEAEAFDVERAIKEFTDYYEFQKAIGFRHCRSKMDEGDHSHVALNPENDSNIARYNFVFTCKRNAIYNSSFNLREYPFDEQKLVVAMIFNLDQYSAKLAENLISRSTFLHKNFHLHDIFGVVNGKTVATEITFSDPQYSSVQASYSVVDFSVTLRRKYSYFIGNFILPILMITVVSLTSFDAEEFNDRLQITSTLWLTIVTYKLMLVDILPPISYFTYLNYYIIFCFFYIALVTFFAVYPEPNTVMGKSIEFVERVGLFVTFVMAHIGAWVYLKIYVFDKHARDDEKSAEYEKKVNKLTQKMSHFVDAVIPVLAVNRLLNRVEDRLPLQNGNATMNEFQVPRAHDNGNGSLRNFVRVNMLNNNENNNFDVSFGSAITTDGNRIDQPRVEVEVPIVNPITQMRIVESLDNEAEVIVADIVEEENVPQKSDLIFTSIPKKGKKRVLKESGGSRKHYRLRNQLID